MTTYTVEITEVVTYRLRVQATGAQEATQQAEDTLVATDDTGQWFYAVLERDARVVST